MNFGKIDSKEEVSKSQIQKCEFNKTIAYVATPPSTGNPGEFLDLTVSRSFISCILLSHSILRVIDPSEPARLILNHWY